MREVLSYRDISYITSLIDEVITDEPKSVSQYDVQAKEYPRTMSQNKAEDPEEE